MKLLTLALFVLALCTSAVAQSNVVSGYLLESRFTGGEGPGRGLGVSFEHALHPWLVLAVEAQGVGSEYTDSSALITVDFGWHERTQLVGGVSLGVRPLRFEAFGFDHGLWVSIGPALRWKNERFLFAGWPGTHNEGDSDGQLESAQAGSEAWAALGEDHEVISFYYEGGTPEGSQLPDSWFTPGYVYALVLSNEELDLGLSGGVSYDLSWGRTVVGTRAQYRRYLGQEAITGSHSLDLSVRAGYRF